jgi:hypothetical protein
VQTTKLPAAGTVVLTVTFAAMPVVGNPLLPYAMYSDVSGPSEQPAPPPTDLMQFYHLERCRCSQHSRLWLGLGLH